jgi:bifunctional N-acetylglucosamine-1-phosphate-uridyltransferase/glucosamine-1-phosphate-acetyltransferase GlmU-like protein
LVQGVDRNLSRVLIVIQGVDRIAHEREAEMAIADDATVGKRVVVDETALVEGKTVLTGSVHIADYACVRGRARVERYAQVLDHATATDDVVITDSAHVAGYAIAAGSSRIERHAILHGHVWVGGRAIITDYVHAAEHAWVGGTARVGANARLRRDMWVTEHVSRNRSDWYTFTIAPGRAGGLWITAGCRTFGSLDEAREHWRNSTALGSESLMILHELETEFRKLAAATRQCDPDWAFLPPGWTPKRQPALLPLPLRDRLA